MKFLDKIESPWLLLLGLALLVFLLMRRSYRYRGRRRKQGHDVADIQQRGEKSEPRRDTPLMDAPAEWTRWHVEMHEVSRDIKGELDSKMRTLQIYLRQAEAATQRLQAAIDQLQESTPSPTASSHLDNTAQSLVFVAKELSQLASEISSPLAQTEFPPPPTSDGNDASQESPPGTSF